MCVKEIDGRLIELEVRWDRVADRSIYPFSIPAIKSIEKLDLDYPVTFLVGENGSGKSTLLEAIAVNAGLNAEGGSGNLRFTTHDTHSSLHEFLELWWRGQPKKSFFLRAESFYNVASRYDQVFEDGRNLHERSHGESFLEAVQRHFGSRGIYLLDEPESALSVTGQMALLRHVHDRVRTGGQFIISTHSPILLAYPQAMIFEMTDRGVRPIEYAETEQLLLTRSFLEDPDRFFRHLFDED